MLFLERVTAVAAAVLAQAAVAAGVVCPERTVAATLLLGHLGVIVFLFEQAATAATAAATLLTERAASTSNGLL